MKPLNRYLLVVRQRAFEVIAAPTWMGIRAPYASLMHVCAHIELDITASSAVIVARNPSFASTDELPDWPADPVTVLARYSDDGFELLRQYDLLPNPKAQASAKIPEATMDCPPCIFPSRNSRIISVAPSCCEFRVGSSGKGFWTETRNITLRHARTPARCLVGFTVRSNPYESETKDPSRRTAHFQLCKDTLYTRRCNISEILWKKYMISSTALEDTVGRIAVGDVTGRVEVLDLA